MAEKEVDIISVVTSREIEMLAILNGGDTCNPKFQKYKNKQNTSGFCKEYFGSSSWVNWSLSSLEETNEKRNGYLYTD